MIQVTNLSVAYDAQSTAIENVSLTIAEPMIMGIIGPNGAGKSTLLKATLSLLPFKGTVAIAGEEAKKGRKHVAYVEQKSQIDATFPITVRECASLGTYNEVGLFRKVKKSIGSKSMKHWQRSGWQSLLSGKSVNCQVDSFSACSLRAVSYSMQSTFF